MHAKTAQPPPPLEASGAGGRRPPLQLRACRRRRHRQPTAPPAPSPPARRPRAASESTGACPARTWRRRSLRSRGGGGGEGNGRVGSLCAARGARKNRRGEGLCDGSCHACRRTGQCRAKTSHRFPPRLRRTGRPRRDQPRRRKRRVSRGERRGHVATSRRSIPTAATRAQGRRLLEEHAID